MTTYAAPLRDIEFVLNDLLDYNQLTGIERFAHADVAVVHDLLTEAGRFMGETIAPLNQSGDVQGSVRNADGSVTTPKGFAAAYSAYVQGGWGAVPFEPEFGGGGFPWIIGVALQEILCSANMAFSMAPLLTQGAIDAVEHQASAELKATYLPKMVSGEWTGTMNLTEPDAGSDVGAVRTRADKQADGTYKIKGTKIYITFGEHDMADNIVHLVLARTQGAPAGTRGISCFIVPKFLVNADGSLGERNDVSCVSIEHKMGIKASPTCVLEFGEKGGAIGYLLGEENRGMQTMFIMMNQARLSVGLEGLSLAERAYQQALAFAQERRQGRAPGAQGGGSSAIIEHPDVRRMLLTMKSTIEAMRRLHYWNALAIDLGRHHGDEAVRNHNNEVAALLTPLSKAWATDMSNELTGIAIQVHGGMGFIEETGVAQHYRDARITTIYEGTNGIQAMDLVGRKLPMRGGAAVRDHLGTIGALDPELAKHPELAQMRDELHKALTATSEATEWLLKHGSDGTALLSAATPYLKLLATVTAASLMARSALVALKQLAAGGGDEKFLRAKVTTARFFCEQLLPPTCGLLTSVTAGSTHLFDLDAQALNA